MLSYARNNVFTKECVLLGAVKISASFFEGLGVDGAKIEPNSIADRDGRPKCQPIDVAQALGTNTQPGCLMTQCFERMHFDRIVGGNAVIIGIG